MHRNRQPWNDKRANAAFTGEQRLAYWFKEVGPNLKTLGGEMKDMIDEAAADRDVIKIAIAPFAIAARALLQGPDYILSGIADRKVEPVSGSETLHDLGRVGTDLITLHPIRALVGALKLPGDLGMDIIKGIGGFRGRATAVLNAA